MLYLILGGVILNNRLKELRSFLDLPQEEFGNRIGIKSRAHISSLENGTRNLTDRIIADICREFNVNEAWLRFGEGEMFGLVSYDDQYAMSVGRILAEEHPMARKVFSELAHWDEEQWDFVEALIERLHKKNE